MQRTRRVVLGLAERGWDVVVSTEDSQSRVRARDWAGSLPIEAVPTEIDYDDFSLKAPGSIRAMAEKERAKAEMIERLGENHEFDVTWIPFPSHELVAGLLGRRRQYAILHDTGVPLVFDVQGVEANLFRSPLIRWASLLAEIRQIARCTGAVFVDRYPHDILSSFVPGPTALIPNGVDTARFRPLLEVDPRYLTFVGRLAPERGIWTFLKAVRLLSGRDLSFRVVGAGPALPAAVEYCRHHELPVTFLGNLPHDGMPCIYRESLAVVNPIQIDGISQISLEAIACGAVVLKSENRTSEEAFEHERTALLFPRGDVHALAEEMESVAVDGETRRRISRRGRELVVENYSLTREIERIESFLLNVAGVA